MNLRLGLTMLLLCSLTSCRKCEPISLTRDALVGHYLYKSEDPDGRATDHELDSLTLHSDGSYDLVQGGSTKPRTETAGRWSFVGGDRPSVGLDHAGYPIRVERNEIRLLIDDDVGIWYAKVK